MTNETNALEKILKDCCGNDAAKTSFMSDPKTVLAENGCEVPADMDIKVVENTENVTYIVLPAMLSSASAEGDISDEELSQAAGGCITHPTVWSWNCSR